MDRLRNQLFTRSALALDQHGRPARRDLRDHIKQPQHHLALAHDVLKRVPLFQRALELYHFLLGAVASNGRANIRQQFFVVPRLLYKVRRTRANCVDDIADGSVRGNHDDRQFRHQRLDAWQQVDPALTRQRQVQQQQIIRMSRQQIETRLTIRRHLDRESFQHQQCFERVPNAGLVVDNQNALCIAAKL